MAEREKYPKYPAINTELLRGDWVKRPLEKSKFRCPLCGSENARPPDRHDYGVCFDCGEMITG